jgi:chorismate dehydratase
VSTLSEQNDRLRVSAISYLNTVPLVYDFTHEPTRTTLSDRFDVQFTLPARCAEQLREGSADIGIIPVAAYTTIPDLHILPGAAIAAKHPVRSILLVSKRELKDVRTVAADASSRTSVALMKTLFTRHWKRTPEYTTEFPDLESMLTKHDAALLIGDPALRVDITDPRFVYFDLAEEWQIMTGLPFVFAFWTVRGARLEAARQANACEVFQRSRDAGLAHIDSLVAEHAARYHVTPELAHRYLSYHINYHLDADNLRGLELFYRYAAECGSLPSAPPLRFV